MKGIIFDLDGVLVDSMTAHYKAWKTALEDVILQYTYPRVDTEVSKHLNHLLKSPFEIGRASCRERV